MSKRLPSSWIRIRYVQQPPQEDLVQTSFVQAPRRKLHAPNVHSDEHHGAHPNLKLVLSRKHATASQTPPRKPSYSCCPIPKIILVASRTAPTSHRAYRSTFGHRFHSMNPFLGCLGILQNKKKKKPATKVVTPHTPDVKGFKWKFIDAKAFVFKGKLTIVEVEDFRTLDFVAISYTWSKHVLAWRKWILSLNPNDNMNQTRPTTSESEEAWEGIKQFHLFFTIVSFLVAAQGKTFFWMDLLSIDQDSKAEKQFFVPKMGLLYGAASITHVYATGSTFVTSIPSNELYFPVWETRAWTLQEYILSKNVIYCYCFVGDVMRELKMMKSQTTRLPSPTTELGTPTIDRYRTSSPDSNIFVLEKGLKKVTCSVETEWTGMSLTTGSYFDTEGLGPLVNQIIGRSTMSKVLIDMRAETSKPRVISTSMALLGGRKSTQPEDMMYSVLGILEMEDFPVRYEIGFDEARLRVFEYVKPHILAVVLGTDWGCHRDGDAKNKDSALPRIVNSEPVIGIERMNITNSAKYTRERGTLVTSRKEKFRLWKDLSRTQSRSTAVVRATLGSQTSRLLILFCASISDNPDYATIPTAEIPKEDIRPVIVSGESRLSDDGYFSEDVAYEKEVEFVELAVCSHHALFPDPGDEKYSRHTALLALECEESDGCMRSRGTVLILDASALSGPTAVHTIQ